MRRRRAAWAATALAVSVAVVGGLGGCGILAGPTSSPTASPVPTRSADPLAGLTVAQRVGQLFIVGTTATAAQGVTLDAVRSRFAGGVFLSGRSRAGTQATADVVAELEAAATGTGIPLLVSTDQEGGEVQVLSGPGFDTIPSALQQSALSPAALRKDAARWGAQLAAAGVDLDLAPVVDIVPDAAAAAANPPIGQLDREYGYGEQSVAPRASAFASGLRSAGVEAVAKHFPGLGRVAANTDTTAGVTDTVIDAGSPDVDVYRQLLASGVDAVMVSSAVYARLDAAQPACFSPAVVTGLLRGDLGFAGIVLTDDLSGATQVLQVAPGDRAIRAIEAGVDLVLVSRIPTVAPAMIDAVVARAESDPAFARTVDAAARRVVLWKREHRDG